MMHRVRRLWAGMALVAISTLAGCRWEPLIAEGPHADVAGEYEMKVFRGFPLPYFDLESQEQVRSRTLELRADGTYTQTVDGFYSDEFVQGTFDVSGDVVVLKSATGAELRLNLQAGVLRTAGEPAELAYVLQGATVPAEYRLRAFTLRSCGGHTPTALDPCRGPGYDVYASTAWLSDAGRFYRSDIGVGAVVRASGTYTAVAGDSVVFSAAERGWSARSALRADSLMTGTFVYVAPAP